eukprot:859545-Prorocentrum_minimum.AAC.3
MIALSIATFLAGLLPWLLFSRAGELLLICTVFLMLYSDLSGSLLLRPTGGPVATLTKGIVFERKRLENLRGMYSGSGSGSEWPARGIGGTVVAAVRLEGRDSELDTDFNRFR